MPCTRRGVKTERTFYSVSRIFDHHTHLRAAQSLTAHVWDVLHLCASFASSSHNMFHRPLLDVPDPFPSYSTPPPSTPTALSMTGIRKSPCATPHGGLLFGHLAESTPLTGYEPKTCIDVSSMRAPFNTSRRKQLQHRAQRPYQQSQPPKTPMVFNSKRQPTVARSKQVW